MGFFSDIFSDREKEYGFTPEPKFIKQPEYAEATKARGTWGDKLTEWGGQEGYGAISPDWEDIWGQAQKRIKQTYWGGPGGQVGLADKVRSSAAARGVSESPALQTELTRMGMQEGADIKDAAVTQATTEAAFGETGRQNWMSQIMQLAGLQMPGAWQSATDMTPEASPVMGSLGNLLGSGMDWLSNLLPMASTAVGGMFGGAGGGDIMGGVTSGGGIGSIAKEGVGFDMFG